MKIKLPLYISLFLALSGNVTAQEYIPMINNTSWNVVVRDQLGAVTYKSVVQTPQSRTFGNFTYKRFVSTIFGNEEIFMREDVQAKKVYRYNYDSSGMVDELMFDFSLQVGESIVLGNGVTYIVRQISPVQMANGTQGRTFALSANQAGYTNEIWIEGVGNTNHPLKAAYELNSDPVLMNTCASQNGVGIFNRGMMNGGTALPCQPPLSIDEIVSQNISLYPNPFSKTATITFGKHIENATLQFTNSIGQVVKEMKQVSGQEIQINRDNLGNGLYFVRLLTDGETLAVKKIIIAD